MSRIAQNLGPDETTRRLDGWLKHRLGDPTARVLSCQPASGGISSETLLLDVEHSGAPRRSLVVRVQPAAHQQVYLDADVLAQAAAVRAVARTVPVPEVVWEEPDPAALGVPFFVMERVPGRIPPTTPSFHARGWVTELAPTERRRLAMNAIDVLATINREKFGGPVVRVQPQGCAPGLDGYLHWVRRWLMWSAEGTPPELFTDAVDELFARRPPDEPEPSLIWGDCRPGNMIVGPNLDVVAVLDWEMVGIGPAEVDLGWWLMMERWTTEGFRVPPLQGWPSRAEFIDRYEAGLGRTTHDLDYYELLASTRYAIIGLRTTNLMIRAGALPPHTDMGTVNPVTQILCDLMGRPVPQLSPDVEAALSAMSLG
jgi:aminoglycoside phosphotransferase (APT) family kinase protein